MKTTYTRWPLSDLALTLGAVYMAGIATGAAVVVTARCLLGVI